MCVQRKFSIGALAAILAILAGCTVPTPDCLLNRQPTADAGSDQNAEVGQRVTLDGRGSTDPDDDPLTFAWKQRRGPNVDLDDDNSVQASFFAAEDGFYEFTLTVTDGCGGSDISTVRVFVGDVDPATCPRADAGVDQTVNEGSAVILRGGNSADPAGGPLDYEWFQSSGQQVSINGVFVAEPTFVAPQVTDAEVDLAFELTVVNEQGCSDTDTVVITVKDRDPSDPCKDVVCDDDGQFCNGVESCSDGVCVSSGNPCGANEACNEATDSCEAEPVCTADEHCGPGELCCEASDTCAECCSDADCQADAQKMYWADAGTHKIQSANLEMPEGETPENRTDVEDLVTGLGQPSGVSLDLENGKMYWPDFTAGKIQRSNLDGSCVEDLITGLVEPSLIALDLAAKNMYWGVSGKMQRSNLDGSNVEELVVEGLSCPRGTALDLDADKIYWSDRCTGKIQRANLDGSGLGELVAGSVVPLALALDLPAGKLYWAEAGTDEIGSGDGKIRRVNLDGSAIEDFVAGLEDPQGIALDLEAGKIYWTDAGTDKIQRANLEIPEGETPDDRTDIEDLVTAGLEQPRGIALDLGKATVCVEGACAPSCTSETDCNDGDLCTMDQCTEGACVNTPVDCLAGETCNRCTGECGSLVVTP